MEKIGRTKIVDLLKRTDIGAMVNVKGWVRTRRGSKQVNFIALNDGSTINNLQVVVDLANFDEEMLKLITTGACISVNGEMVESVGSGQKVEVQAREIEVLGTCDNTYPCLLYTSDAADEEDSVELGGRRIIKKKKRKRQKKKKKQQKSRRV